MKRMFIAGLLLACVSVCQSTEAKVQHTDVFSALPIVSKPALSPDGKTIATIYNSEDGPQVVITPFPSTDLMTVARLKKARDRVEFVKWSGSRWIIIGTSYPEVKYGRYFRVQRLYAYDVKENELKEVLTRKMTEQKWFSYSSVTLQNSLKSDPDNILITFYDELDEGQSVFRVNLPDMSFDKIQRNIHDISSWGTDRQGNVRLGVHVEEKGDKFVRELYYRSSPDKELSLINTRVLGESETFNIVGMTENGSKAYVLSDHDYGRESLWLYNIDESQFEELLYTNENYDVSGALTTSQDELIGAYYYDDFYRTFYFDEKEAELEQTVAKLLKGYEVTIATQSEDKKRLLVSAVSDNKVPVYFYVDLNTNQAGVWLAAFPHIAKFPFPSVEKFSFTASDGMKLSGYLTLPTGIEKPPLVVMPHGGPHARDYKYFDPFLQFLVAQGYAVMQVNFRGSAGFGNYYETSGYNEWGKAMQQDVYDAMDYIIADGRVSDSDSCVVGASYGGYVALTAAFQQPDRFDCIVSISGISDVRELVEQSDRHEFYVANIADAKNSDELKALEDVSAINHINRIRSPVLLIHGTRDTSVEYAQSKDFYNDAKRKIDVEYVEIKNGTHYFDDNESRNLMFSKVGEFLDEHLH